MGALVYIIHVASHLKEEEKDEGGPAASAPGQETNASTSATTTIGNAQPNSPRQPTSQHPSGVTSCSGANPCKKDKHGLEQYCGGFSSWNSSDPALKTAGSVLCDKNHCDEADPCVQACGRNDTSCKDQCCFRQCASEVYKLIGQCRACPVLSSLDAEEIMSLTSASNLKPDSQLAIRTCMRDPAERATCAMGSEDPLEQVAARESEAILESCKELDLQKQQCFERATSKGSEGDKKRVRECFEALEIRSAARGAWAPNDACLNLNKDDIFKTYTDLRYISSEAMAADADPTRPDMAQLADEISVRLGKVLKAFVNKESLTTFSQYLDYTCGYPVVYDGEHKFPFFTKNEDYAGRDIGYLSSSAADIIADEEYIEKAYVAAKGDKAKVVIYFQDFQTTSETELPKTDEMTLIGNLGGTLGLCCGFSILTFLEFGEFFVGIALWLIWEAMFLAGCVRSRFAKHDRTAMIAHDSGNKLKKLLHMHRGVASLRQVLPQKDEYQVRSAESDNDNKDEGAKTPGLAPLAALMKPAAQGDREAAV